MTKNEYSTYLLEQLKKQESIKIKVPRNYRGVILGTTDYQLSTEYIKNIIVL